MGVCGSACSFFHCSSFKRIFFMCRFPLGVRRFAAKGLCVCVCVCVCVWHVNILGGISPLDDGRGCTVLKLVAASDLTIVKRAEVR